ncbi:MAG TPA: protein YgfX [Rudaea sp.]|jgi:toxin CptA|uniref:protein YgfX n=1 Tax=Rudaea sp. TaxID=2136325 RepID=UPI002F958508
MKSVPAIAFDYRPSRWLAAGIVAIALLALVAIVASGLNAWIRLGLVVVVGAYAAWSLRAFLRPRFDHVTWHSAGHWRLRDVAGQEHVAEFVRATVLGALIVLILRIGPGRKIALLLLPDNCDAETQRRLRVRLTRAQTDELA